MLDGSTLGMSDSSADLSPSAVAQRVRSALQQRGITQAELARALGMEKTKLSKSLSAARRFRAEELAGIAQAAGVRLEWLLEGRGTGSEPVTVPNARARDAATVQSVVPGEERRARGIAHLLGDPAAAAADASEHRAGAGRTGSQRRADSGRRSEQVRARISRAAWKLFSEWGYHRVRMADIAAAAGVSTAAVHYHFSTKHALFISSLHHSAARLDDERAGVIDAERERLSAGDPQVHLELLRRLIVLKVPRAIVEEVPAEAPAGSGETALLAGDWSIWLQNFAEIAVGVGSREAAGLLAQDWNQVLAIVIEAGQRAGVLRQRPAQEAAAELSMFLDGVVVRALADPELDTERAIERYLHHALLVPEAMSRLKEE